MRGDYIFLALVIIVLIFPMLLLIPRKYLKTAGLIFLCIIIIITLCVFFSMKKRNLDDVYDELLSEKIKWKESGITNYRYRVRDHWSGEMGNPLNSVVIVKDGNYYGEYSVGIKDYTGGDTVYFIRDYMKDFITIDSIYEYMEEYFARYKTEKRDFVKGYCKNITIKFDSDNHIPTAIEWEWWHNPFVDISDRLRYTYTYIEDFIIE